MSTSSPYLLEQRHQQRLILGVLAVLVIFGAGIRFDRAILIDPSRPTQPGSAFAAVVPAPVVFPGAPGQAANRGRTLRRAGGDDTASAATPGEFAETGTGEGAGGPIESPAIDGGSVVTPITSPGTATDLANGQFGGGTGSLFGIPTGVIFAGSGGGDGGTGPGGGGVTPGIVPEPETWAFMILGVGMIGGMMRRRRARRESGATGVTLATA